MQEDDGFVRTKLPMASVMSLYFSIQEEDIPRGDSDLLE